MTHDTPKIPGGGAFGRSARREVKNPVLALPGLHALLALPADQRTAIAALLMDLSVSAAARANVSWCGNKGIMAAYWKAVSVYAKHIARAIKAGAA